MSSYDIDNKNLDEELFPEINDSPLTRQKTTLHNRYKALECIKQDMNKIYELAPEKVRDFLLETNHSNESETPREGYFQKNTKQIEKHLMKQQFLENSKLFDPTKYFGGLNIVDLSEGTDDQRLEAMFLEYMPTEQEENAQGMEKDIDQNKSIYLKAVQTLFPNTKKNNNNMSLKDRTILFKHKNINGNKQKHDEKPPNKNIMTDHNELLKKNLHNDISTKSIKTEKVISPRLIRDNAKISKSKNPSISKDNKGLDGSMNDNFRFNKENTNNMNLSKPAHINPKPTKNRVRNPSETKSENKYFLTSNDEQDIMIRHTSKSHHNKLLPDNLLHEKTPSSLMNNYSKQANIHCLYNTINNTGITTTTATITANSNSSDPKSTIPEKCMANSQPTHRDKKEFSNTNMNKNLMETASNGGGGGITTNDNMAKSNYAHKPRTAHPSFIEDNPSPMLKSLLSPKFSRSPVFIQKIPNPSSTTTQHKVKNSSISHVATTIPTTTTTAHNISTCTTKSKTNHLSSTNHLKMPKTFCFSETMKFNSHGALIPTTSTITATGMKKSQEIHTQGSIGMKTDRSIAEFLPHTNKIVAHIYNKFNHEASNARSNSTSNVGTFVRKLFPNNTNNNNNNKI